MNTIRHSLLVVATLGAATANCATVATAQVPQDTAVVGTFSGPISNGTSGLFLLPLNGGAIAAISNLPIELQQATGSYQRGVGSVDLRSADGAIACGCVAAASGPGQGGIHLFVLHLNGSTVDSTQTKKIWLGDTVNVGGSTARFLPDGRILVVASDGAGALSTGPMANHLFAIVDVSQATPTFTLLPNPTGSGNSGGIAVDPAGEFAYYVLTTNPGSLSSVVSLYRWEITSGTSCVIATWTGHVGKGISCSDDGTVYVTTNDISSTTHNVHTVVPDNCNSAVVTSVTSTLPLPSNAIRPDSATGKFVVATAGWAPGFPSYRNWVMSVDSNTGTATPLATPPGAGWGMMSDIALRRPMASYGRCSDGQSRYLFDNFPNPGGQPAIGNTSFSMTIRATENHALLSVLGLSLDRASLSVAGIELLLDPNSLVTATLPSALSSTYNLPIPNDPNLSGFVLTAQSLHLEAGGLASSRGLEVTIQ